MARIVGRWAAGDGDVVTGRLWGSDVRAGGVESSDRWQPCMSAAADSLSDAYSCIRNTSGLGCLTVVYGQECFLVFQTP